MTVDWKNIRIGALAIAIGIVTAYFGQPLIHDNSQAVNVIITVFSILAGFLVAIIAIIGDPVLLPPGTWRAAEMERDKIGKRLIRHKWLFFLYLITLALVFATLLLQKKYPEVAIWLERIYLFFGVSAFTFSMRLPSALMGIQKERIDAVIEHRRANDNIKQ